MWTFFGVKGLVKEETAHHTFPVPTSTLRPQEDLTQGCSVCLIKSTNRSSNSSVTWRPGYTSDFRPPASGLRYYYLFIENLQILRKPWGPSEGGGESGELQFFLKVSFFILENRWKKMRSGRYGLKSNQYKYIHFIYKAQNHSHFTSVGFTKAFVGRPSTRAKKNLLRKSHRGRIPNPEQTDRHAINVARTEQSNKIPIYKLH